MRDFRQWCMVGSSPAFWSWVELTVTSSNSQVIQQVANDQDLGEKLEKKGSNHDNVSLNAILGALCAPFFLSEASFP